MTEPERQSLPTRTVWTWAVVGWGLFALVGIAKAWMLGDDRAITVAQSAATLAFVVPLWALFTPAIHAVAVRFPLLAAPRVRPLLAHVGLLLTLMAVASVVRPLVGSLVGTGPASFRQAFLVYFDVQLFAYAAIVALTHVWMLGRRLEHEAVTRGRLEAEATRAELLALEMQIQPHFLFNTLHAISELVHEDAERADRMITALGALLRLSLEHAGDAEVSLREEMAVLEAYLDIQRIRFAGRLRASCEIDATVERARVPSFLLQPIVENAITHGIAQRPGAGSVRIRAGARNGSVEIEVCDDGVGLPLGGAVREGVGMRNVRARLEHLYGDRQSLSVEAGADGGVRVRVALPLRL